MSARAELAQRIADFINEHDLANPFGGEVGEGTRYRPVLLSMPRVLDGEVRIYGPRFIQVLLRGPLVSGDRIEVFESEEATLKFLRALLVDFDGDAADAVPTKAAREAATHKVKGVNWEVQL